MVHQTSYSGISPEVPRQTRSFELSPKMEQGFSGKQQGTKGRIRENPFSFASKTYSIYYPVPRCFHKYYELSPRSVGVVLSTLWFTVYFGVRKVK